MELVILSVHDSKAEAFITPFFQPNLAMGLRAFAQAVNDPESMFHIHPGDYTLFELGRFNSNTGELIPLPSPKNHGLAIIFKRAIQTEETSP